MTALQVLQIPGYFAGIPGNPRVYLEKTRYFADFLGFAFQILPQTSSQTQGKFGKLESCQRSTKCPSVFPGNFRKRKVLGTLSFPFWFPETWIQTGQGKSHVLVDGDVKNV